MSSRLSKNLSPKEYGDSKYSELSDLETRAGEMGGRDYVTAGRASIPVSSSPGGEGSRCGSLLKVEEVWWCLRMGRQTQATL